jgi:CHAT domain-containing protein/Tfp pilus assembly protein PilF
LATAYLVRGETRAGAEALESALELAWASKNTRLEGQIPVNLGRAYGQLGEQQKGLDYSRRALAISRTAADKRAEAVLLNNIGFLYQAMGDNRKAQEYFSQSLSLKRALQDQRGEATTLSNIGTLLAGAGQSAAALEKFQGALPLARATGDRLLEGNILNNIGEAYRGLRNLKEALDFYQQALSLKATIHDRWGEAYTTIGIARTYLQLERYNDALQEFNHALSLARAVEDRNSELEALDGMAHVRLVQNDPEEARPLIESALHIVETSRAEIILPDLRTSYSALHQGYYETAIEILMRLDRKHPEAGYAQRALEVHERGQARSLVELLLEASANIRKGVAPELVISERNIRELLASAVERRLRAQLSNDGGKPTATLNEEIDGLSRRYEQIEADIRAASPEYAALTQPGPLTAHEIQALLRDDATALVEYSLGTERSYGWLLTRTSIRSFQLPPAKTIEDLARSFHALISSRSSATATPNAGWQETAAALGRMLLGPVAPAIKGKRLVIIPAGILCYIPFDALGDPTQPNGKFTPLIAGHEIGTLPSVSVLPLLRRGTGHNSADKLVAVIADPVFDKSDPRIRRSNEVAAAVTRGEDSTEESDTRTGQSMSLGRLAFSRQEAESISAVLPGRLSKKMLDFDASLQAVIAPDVAQYRVLHLATHGILDSQHPDRSALVFSLVDGSGNPQAGLLKMADVFNLSLPADLVVLSACETALGTEIRGEGLVGLTRAFLYAGAKRLLASLWNVDDLATAQLMKAFYSSLAEGKSPMTALRTAKLAIRSNPAWSSPYYWAAFTLQGEFEDSPILKRR